MDWVCFNKGQFSGNTIKIVMSDGGTPASLCTLSLNLPPCWEAPPPCNPNPIDTVWKTNEEGTIEFDCIDGTDTIKCTVTFTYTYRHSSIDNSNDVQILAYNANAACVCKNTIINRILKYIWSKETVMDKFGVSDEDPTWIRGTEKCFYNFRVITSDCWVTKINYNYVLWAYPGIFKTFDLRKRCPSTHCCYANYKVCYYKDNDGQISFSNYERISGILGIFLPLCPLYHCEPDQCGGMLPQGFIHTPPKTNIEYFNNKQIPCNVYVSTNQGGIETLIRFDCSINGTVNIQMYDLLGREILYEEADKYNYSLSLQIKKRLQPGIYFIKLKLNDNSVYYNKFIISE
jgi:hypothetical protein